MIELIGASGTNILEVVASGRLTINVPSVPNAVSEIVTHNLGYIPLVFATVTNPFSGADNPRTMPDLNLNSATEVATEAKMVTVTDTLVSFQVQAFSGSVFVGDWEVRYWICRQIAS